MSGTGRVTFVHECRRRGAGGLCGANVFLRYEVGQLTGRDLYLLNEEEVFCEAEHRQSRERLDRWSREDLAEYGQRVDDQARDHGRG